MTKPKSYRTATESSKSKWSSVAKRLENSGVTSKEALSMSDSDLKKALGFKGKKSSLQGLKRNIRQLSFSLERKQGVLNDTLPKYAKQGYRGKGLNLVKVRLNKTIGLNTFYDIARDVKKEFRLRTDNQAYKKTRELLKKADVNFNRLSRKEKDILMYYS